MPSPTLDPVRDAFAHLSPPVVVFNKSHSGSRLLAELISASGIFMGAHVNESRDSLDIFELVEALVTNYYPNYGPLWDGNAPPDTKLTALAQRNLNRHLDGFDGGRWGWKLCETTYAVPVIDYCFPGARFIHLIRDGRDVSFSDHRAPNVDFWRKVYFNTGHIRTWRGMRLTPQAYRRRPHLFNAVHWVNSVEVGRNYAAMLRERCLEVRYEDLCLRFDATARRVLEFIDAPDPEAAIRAVRSGVRTASVGKHRQQAARKQRQALAITKPLLLSLGYLDADPEPPRPSLWHSRPMDNLIDRYKKRLARRRP
jgi:hypothetical protein